MKHSIKSSVHLHTSLPTTRNALSVHGSVNRPSLLTPVSGGVFQHKGALLLLEVNHGQGGWYIILRRLSGPLYDCPVVTFAGRGDTLEPITGELGAPDTELGARPEPEDIKQIPFSLGTHALWITARIWRTILLSLVFFFYQGFTYFAFKYASQRKS